MSRDNPVDLEGLLRAFAARGVEFVVIGGVSAALQGVPAATFDLDLVFDPRPYNLDRAHALLMELDACLREHLPGERLPLARADLDTRGSKLLMTRLGPLDILGELVTGWRFDEVQSRARSLTLEQGVTLRVLDLAALIEVKEKLGREKDRAVLPLYRKALHERAQDPETP